MYSDDLDYAAKRLNATLVRLNTGEAFYAERTFHDPSLRVKHVGTKLDSGEFTEVFHEDLDLTPVPLGFINISKKMVFVMRKPMRRDWHQGLHYNSIATDGTLRPNDIQISWLLQPIKNQYPTFQRAIKDLKTRLSIAFSRDFGLIKTDTDPILRYRQYNVGTVSNGRAVLSPNKLFLQQHLEEVVGM